MEPLSSRPVGLALLVSCLLLAGAPLAAQRQVERLDRGLVVLRTGERAAHVTWRLLGTEDPATTFDLWRSTRGRAAVKLNDAPLAGPTWWLDTTFDPAERNDYQVVALPAREGEQPRAGRPFTLPASAPVRTWLEVPLQPPPGGTAPDGVAYAYSANDLSVGDLDGDGVLDLVVKWDPSNAKDNSQAGITGNVFLEGLRLDGSRLWRIDLGRNVRAGAHYTQFIVYDLDGDGAAEIACRTADSAVSGTGEVIGDGSADHRNASGYVITGSEFLTVFRGADGSILANVPYEPARGSVSAWGDNYGNRVDRFLAGVAYLDGSRPSLVMCRGYYTRSVLVAWDWRDGVLARRWTFDTGNDPAGPWYDYRGQGAHSLSVGDLDGDGRDEILYGAAAIDDDGRGLYNTRLGHGDALHLSDMDPAHPGLEAFMVHESPSVYGANGSALTAGATGAVLVGVSGENTDVGRGVAADIDPRHPGFELWASRGGLRNVSGTFLGATRPSAMNFLAYWDGDLLRELLDGTRVSKWNWETATSTVLLDATGVASNNGTKANPGLSGDLLGDWREEIVWRTTDSRALRIHVSTIPTEHRLPTFLHDTQYRVALAWQNVGYNQPPHPSYHVGHGMAPPPRPVLSPAGAGDGAARMPGDDLASWLGIQGLPGDADPGSDADGNGLSLRAEHAFGLAAGDRPPGGVVSLHPGGEGRIAVRIPAARRGLRYVIRRSDDLVDWTDLASIAGDRGHHEHVLPTAPSGFVVLEVR